MFATGYVDGQRMCTTPNGVGHALRILLEYFVQMMLNEIFQLFTFGICTFCYNQFPKC